MCRIPETPWDIDASKVCARGQVLEQALHQTVEWTCRAASDLPVGPVVFTSFLHGIRPPRLIVRSSAPKKVKEKRSPFHHHLIVRPPRPAAQYDYDSPARKIADRYAWGPSTISL